MSDDSFRKNRNTNRIRCYAGHCIVKQTINADWSKCKSSGETLENKNHPRRVQSKLCHPSTVYCTIKCAPATVLSWPQVTADKKAESSLKISHLKSVVKQVNGNAVILTCSKAATWRFHYTACKHTTQNDYLHPVTEGETEVLNEGKILLSLTDKPLVYIFHLHLKCCAILLRLNSALISQSRGITSVEWLWYMIVRQWV